MAVDAARADDPFETGTLSVAALFPTPLAIITLADHAPLDAVLAERILKRRADDPGIVASNVGGWHSSDFRSWSDSEGARILDAAQQLVDRLTLMEVGGSLVPARVHWRISAWANVSEAGDLHQPHGHPGAFWSGVYWVDTGGDGADESLGGLFEIADPRGLLPTLYAPTLHHAVENCVDAGSPRRLTPTAGTMILFPAWLVHAVTPYRGARPRISVAFNFSLSVAQAPLQLAET